ncbi:MAG: TolC family protein, partial [Phaeodactylibacter sp.]|nr:TolC family protein [Phaeodactylibacter sp.]
MRYILILIGAILVAPGYGQSLLTLSDAINNTIVQNPSIQIQQLEVTRTTNNVFKANVGGAPLIRAVAGGSYISNYADVRLRTFQAEPAFINISESGVETINTDLGIQAEYVLLDGGRRNSRLQVLKELSNVESARQEVLINQTVLAVSALYFEIAKLQNQASFILESIRNGEARLAKTKDRKQFGQANNLDILRLQTAINQDESMLNDILLVKGNLIRDLNFLMGSPLENEFIVQTESETTDLPELSTIYKSIEANNPELRLSRMGVQVSQSELQLSETDNRPVIAAFGQAGYNYQSNDVQQLARIHAAGVSVGINATYTLFDGGIRKNQTANSRIEVEKALANQQLLTTNLFNQALKEQ